MATQQMLIDAGYISCGKCNNMVYFDETTVEDGSILRFRCNRCGRRWKWTISEEIIIPGLIPSDDRARGKAIRRAKSFFGTSFPFWWNQSLAELDNKAPRELDGDVLLALVERFLGISGTDSPGDDKPSSIRS